MSNDLRGAIIFLLVLALVPALIARRKERGFWAFYLLGIVFWLAAMIWALLVKDERARCPECAEIVRPEATRCPHCQAEIVGRLRPVAKPRPEPL